MTNSSSFDERGQREVRRPRAVDSARGGATARGAATTRGLADSTSAAATARGFLSFSLPFFSLSFLLSDLTKP